MADSPVEKLLSDHVGRSFATKEICDLVGQGHDTVDSMLRRLEKRGDVRKFKPEYGPQLWTWTGDGAGPNEPARENNTAPAHDAASTLPIGGEPAKKVLGSRVALTEELLELEKRIAADTARRSEILAQLT